jgi:hypothetical protein
LNAQPANLAFEFNKWGRPQLRDGPFFNLSQELQASLPCILRQPLVWIWNLPGDRFMFRHSQFATSVNAEVQHKFRFPDLDVRPTLLCIVAILAGEAAPHIVVDSFSL